MKVGELGEFGLIEAVAKVVPPKDPRLWIGIGDDAAVWAGSPHPQIATTDTLIEGVHFCLDTISWFELGWKALAVNLSDVAAMGGAPCYALVTLGLPAQVEVERVLELYRGMNELAALFETTIAGGDMVSSPQAIVITVTVLGQGMASASAPPAFLTRQAARLGYLVAVTGQVGTSGAGRQMLLRGMKLENKVAALLRRAHQQPMPRVREGQVLLACGVRAAIDISDGLVGDLAKMCLASGVGARLRLDSVPLHPALPENFPQDWTELALQGGEDYELLFAAPPPTVAAAQAQLAAEGCAPATVVGEIVEGPKGGVSLVGLDGQETTVWKGGWDHFAEGGRL